MKQTDLMRAQGITERDLIESIINSYFFIDYGTITKVNSDKTVNVQHAKIPVLENGKKLKALQSNNIELLTLSGENFSFNAGTKEGDKVLLLGLKDYIEKVSDVSGAGEQTAYVHYKRDSLKAFPLCTFNGEAKVTVTVEDDTLKLDGKDNGGLVIAPELVTQLGYLTARVDAIIDALEKSPVAAQDGGAAYKSAITTALELIVNKEDFSNIESQKVFHGNGG